MCPDWQWTGAGWPAETMWLALASKTSNLFLPPKNIVSRSLYYQSHIPLPGKVHCALHVACTCGIYDKYREAVFIAWCVRIWQARVIVEIRPVNAQWIVGVKDGAIPLCRDLDTLRRVKIGLIVMANRSRRQGIKKFPRDCSVKLFPIWRWWPSWRLWRYLAVWYGFHNKRVEPWEAKPSGLHLKICREWRAKE